MPSPFPGMDPYLEGELWTTVHSQLAAEVARQLAPKIAPRYIARTEKRFVVASSANADEIAIYADVGVRTSRASSKAKKCGGVLLEAPLLLANSLTRNTSSFSAGRKEVRSLRSGRFAWENLCRPFQCRF